MKTSIKTTLFTIINLLIVTSSFLFVAWIKPATRTHIIPNYIKPFCGFAFVWMFISIITVKYRAYTRDNFAEGLNKILRSDIIILAIVTTSIIFFQRFTYSRSIVFGTILLSGIQELILLVLVFFQRKVRKVDFAESFSVYSQDVTQKKKEKTKQKQYHLPEDIEFGDSLKIGLYTKYFKDMDELCFFVDKNIETRKIPRTSAAILNTSTLYNIENFDQNSQWLFANLHKINDFRRINRYFIQVNENLKEGGYFVGHAETIHERYQKIFKTLPPIISHFVYGCDFLFRRVFPKITLLNSIFFAITKGKNRAISKAEILGRLYYCGFKIVAIKEINNQLYFISRKVAEPKVDKSPSYGPLIKMRRVGKDSKIIHIYKFRTMHPYSEYLQEYMYDSNSLEEGGKIKDDFRITTWGKVFRKLWIDELPQFINVLRGEIGIVGVRALSFHYFGLYPKYLQELRTKFKPGLVPPFYVDLPKTFDEILASEEKYLRKRAKRPLTTNIEYFFKSWYNILIRKARSQ